jgi:PhzF family phenazine biosynthesis protein
MPPIYVVDAFTDRPFAGNPAAICLLDAPRDERWMQQLAAEMNLSETAFVERRPESFGLRWFTPGAEVDLCGHATLAAAHVLWESGLLPPEDEARFDTRSGRLTVRRAPSGVGAMEMDFPGRREREHARLPELEAALGVSPRYFGRNAYDYFAVLGSADEVRSVSPDFRRLRALPVRGVIVTAPGDPGSGHDFVSRFFAPGVGVDEDPVTGSAHCCLAPYWSERLGRAELVGYQASKRGGVVRVRVAGDRVVLGGSAVTVVAGELDPRLG